MSTKRRGRPARKDDERGDLSHVDERGRVKMVDVGEKATTARRAVARAIVHMSAATAGLLAEGRAPKGDVLAVVRVAAIQAAKKTPELVPLCHAIALTRVGVDIEVGESSVTIEATAEARDRTGVEMEALAAASVGALTLYDMLKAVDRGMRFEVALLEKEGGRTGTWRAPQAARGERGTK